MKRQVQYSLILKETKVGSEIYSIDLKSNQKEEKNVYMFQGEDGQKGQNKMSQVKCVGDIKNLLEVYSH